MLFALGFVHAPDWKDEKLKAIAVEAAQRFPPNEIPENYRETFEELKEYARSGEFVVFVKPKIKR